MDSIRPTEYQISLLRNFGCHILAPLAIGGLVFTYKKGALPFRWVAETQYALLAALVTEVAIVAARHFDFMQKMNEKKEGEASTNVLTPIALQNNKDLEEGVQESLKTLALDWERQLSQLLNELLGSSSKERVCLLDELNQTIQKMRSYLPKKNNEKLKTLIESAEALVNNIREQSENLKSQVLLVADFSKLTYQRIEEGLEAPEKLDKKQLCQQLSEAKETLNKLFQADTAEDQLPLIKAAERFLQEGNKLLEILNEDMTKELAYRQRCLDAEDAFIERLEKQLGGKLIKKSSDGNCLFSSLEEFSDQYPEKNGVALRKDCVAKALKEVETSSTNGDLRLQVEDAVKIGRFEGYPSAFRQKLEELKEKSAEDQKEYFSEANGK